MRALGIRERHAPGAAAQVWWHFHSDRACVEHFLGPLERVFPILSDHCRGLSWDKLDDVVTWRVPLMNSRHRHRGHLLTRPLIVATRYVPWPIPESQLFHGRTARELPSPPVHKPVD